MNAKLVRLNEVNEAGGGSALSALMKAPDDRIRRDVMMLLSPEDSHDHLEEVYFFTHGKGVMVVGDEEMEVAAGDVVYVPFGPFHTTRNPYNQPLEYFWVTTPHGAKAKTGE
jgi:mannose-6-phosphate isomerase-like protein (cupin superfamily)